LPNGATGQWFDPEIGDPYYHQAHIGYSHELSPRTVLSVDFTHVAGRNDIRALEINPIVNGVRVLAPALASALGNANQLGSVKIQAAVNRSRYDALTFQFQRRFPRATLQAHYTLSGAFTYGSALGTLQSQDQFDIFGPGEWGPTEADERHRIVAFGVLDLRYGIQLSPVFQWASARPYTLIAGTDLNRDGTVNDRYVDPVTGRQMAVNSERGDTTTLLDLRATKFFTFGANRRLGVFAEVFNVFNTANFGNSYTGNALAVTFKQPMGFIPGIGYQRQMQLGARFLF
jgi:hypothetical protein